MPVHSLNVINALPRNAATTTGLYQIELDATPE
jgi:hypothetical protein